MELSMKTVGIAAVALLVAGSGTAALLDAFGTVSGTSGVSQAVDIPQNNDNVVNFAFDSTQDDVVPPETYTETVTLENNNDDTPVSFNWASSVSSDTGNNNGVQTGVYQVESYDLYQTSYGESLASKSDADQPGVSAEVIPSDGETTYSVELPSGYSYVNVEVTPEQGDNYHVIYDGSDFHYKEPSKSGSPAPASQFSKFVSGSASSDRVNFTVERASGYSQSFFVHIGGEFDGDSSTSDLMMTPSALEMDIDSTTDYSGDSSGVNGPGYSDTGEFGHDSFDMTDLVGGSEETLSGGASQTYNAYTHFQSNIAPGSYTVDLFAAPATP